VIGWLFFECQVRAQGSSAAKRTTDYGQLTTMRYSWLDLLFYILAFVLLVPLVMRLAESIMGCME